jgi:DNA primase
VRRVREESDIVGIISQHTALKRSGRQWTGLCPFHGEKTPSFSVSSDKNVFYCFGCQRSGDVIGFVQEMEGLDFVASVEWLAAKAGITLRYTDAGGGRQRRRRDQLVETVEAAVAFYHRRLMEAPDGGPARAYLRQRGYDREVVERFRLGWAPDAWDELLRGLGMPPAQVEAAGLAFTNRRNRLQDFFRARVMFPILDVNGAAVAFGGRQLPGGDPPKYKNTANNELYDKSRVLYGLNWAKQDAVATNEIVVCEGYTDVIGFQRAGISRAVATCGTALTDQHVQVMRRFASRIVLAFDADDAGRGAADRFYEWEQAHDVEVLVADLPDGVDPGELAGRDPDRLVAAVRDAKPFLGFRLERSLGQADVRSPEGRARAAERAAAVIAEHPSELVRDQYLMQVADRLDLPIDRLRLLHGAQRGRSTEPIVAPAGPAWNAEALLLRILVDDPAAAGERVDPVLFDSPTARAACGALRSGIPVASLLDQVSSEVAVLLSQIAMADPPEDAESQLGVVAGHAARRAFDGLTRRARLEPDRLADYQPSLAWLHGVMTDLHEPERRLDAVDQLVPWLQEHEARERGHEPAP